MGESLYRLLGVDRDADDAAISRAYRERVMDHHPDVSDEPDAAEEFKRLTTARDVLLDEHARARYDRLGHDAYVTAELEGERWTGTTERPSETHEDVTATRETDHARHRTNKRSTTDTRTKTVHSRTTTASASTSPRSRWNTTSARHGYRPPGVATESATPLDRALASFGSLGPWLVVHAVFLATAAGAAALLSASMGSVPALSLPLGTGLFGLALFLSALHVVSILYV